MGCKKRDRFALTRKDLLEDYASISRRRPGAALATGLRNESDGFLDILAAQAMGTGDTNWNKLRQLIATSPASVLPIENADSLGEIGVYLALQPEKSRDLDLATVVLNEAISRLPENLRSRRARELLTDIHIIQGDVDEARSCLLRWPDVARQQHSYRSTDLSLLESGEQNDSLDEWLQAFNEVFLDAGLTPVTLEGKANVLFDRLRAKPSARGDSTTSSVGPAPQVSVIVTTFNPEADALRTSIQSLLDQTLSNIEVIIVDDASGPQYQEVLSSVVGMDSRIRLIRASQNGGTYLARNLGLEAARGEFVTGQDDDDWSHPQRLEQQVAFLQQKSEAVGCRVRAIAMTSTLRRVRLGYRPLQHNASSLMLRRADFLGVGGFVQSRKAADTELYLRVQEVTGREIIEIDRPLTAIRIAEDSLSRSDFRAGWSHPARQAFQSSYRFWHDNASMHELRRPAESTSGPQVPARWSGKDKRSQLHFDVILAGDWRHYGGPQKSMLEEIHALRASGLSVGVMHLEAPRFMGKRSSLLTRPVQSLINSGSVKQVLYDDDASTKLLILRYPPILQFAKNFPSSVRADHMVIVANQAPSELDGSDVRYLIPDCTDNARFMFQSEVTWVPQGPQVREAIAPYLGHELAKFDFPGILSPDEWFKARRRRRSVIPVVGRYSRDNHMKWPETADAIREVYPVDGRFDIRIMGGAMVPTRILSRTTFPAAWTVYETDAMPVERFLETLDFFVFYQHSVAVEAFGRSILEAIAAGVVVILPPHYQDVFGEGAIYADRNRVQDVVRTLHADPKSYDRQIERARAVMSKRFSHATYIEQIESLLERSAS